MAYRYSVVVAFLLANTLFGQIHRRSVSIPDTATLNLNDMHYPVDGVLVSGHGWRNGRMHHGLDISDNNRDTVRASYLGKVRYSKKGYNGGYGYLIIITHLNGLETYYAHLRELLVDEGQWIPAGTPIGIVGSTGNSLGPHLHFEVRYQGISLDPEDIMQGSAYELIRKGNKYIVK